MKNSIIAKTYAQAVIEIAKTKNCAIFDEISQIIQILNQSPQLEQVLFLNVFTLEEKSQVLKDILQKLGAHALTSEFLQFLLTEKRLPLLPQIYKELIVIEDAARGFMKVNVEGPQTSLDEGTKTALEKYLQQKLHLKSEISYQQKTNISAGYRITAGDFQLDATLKTQLQNFKNTFFE